MKDKTMLETSGKGKMQVRREEKEEVERGMVSRRVYGDSSLVQDSSLWPTCSRDRPDLKSDNETTVTGQGRVAVTGDRESTARQTKVSRR